MKIIDKYNAEKNWLIAIFQDIQQEYRYLPKEAIGRVAMRLKIPLTQAYMVATFYKSFSLVPRGEHEIHVCLGTACHLRGRPAPGGEFRADPGREGRGDTTKDMKFTLETVNCLGACALAPLVRVDQKNYGKSRRTRFPRSSKNIDRMGKENPMEKIKTLKTWKNCEKSSWRS